MSLSTERVDARERDVATKAVSCRSLFVHPLNTQWKKRLVAQWSPLVETAGALCKWPDAAWDYRAIESEAHFIDDRPRGSIWTVEKDGQDVVLGVILVSGPIPLSVVEKKPPSIDPDPRVLWIENIAIAPGLRRDCPGARRLPFEPLRLGQLMTKWAIQESARQGSGWIGLHADGEAAERKYGRRSDENATAWDMRSIGALAHRTGGSYTAFVGDDVWSAAFVRSLDEALTKEIGS